MATAAASKIPARPATGAQDRRFYTGMSILMAVTIFVGFAPTFYLRSFFSAPVTITGSASLSPLAQLHGAVFSGWIALFILQTALVASHRVGLHRRLGIAGAILAASMFVIGTITAVKAAARGSAPPGADPLAFLAIPFGDMVLFALFFCTAIWQRNNKETHKRLMLLAYISIAAAGVARLPGVLPLGPFGFYGLTTIFLLMGIAYDWVSRGRIHAAYIWGGGFFVASVPLRLMFSGTGTWHNFAAFLIRTF